VKKITLLIFLGLFLNGCATTSSNMEKGNVEIGMNKKEFCIAVTTFKWSHNPCAQPLFSSLNEVPGIYYPETKMEIMHDSQKEYFFVFENVNVPYDYNKLENGDGTLIKIFRNFEEAKVFASGRKFAIGSDKVENAKQICKSKGFEPGTEEFADCSLKELKAQSQ
tara:strand:+ start:100 stop:594 length:495 start_codon:yes stop_codon:yes gene_type:complete